MKKYKLKLDYTEDELKELKELRRHYDSPMDAIRRVVKTGVKIQPYDFLWRKYRTLDSHKEFDFMADINNVAVGTAIFPNKLYIVHDKFTDQYIYYSTTQMGLCWGQPHSGKAVTNIKEGWLAINPAYEPMLERL